MVYFFLKSQKSNYHSHNNKHKSVPGPRSLTLWSSFKLLTFLECMYGDVGNWARLAIIAPLCTCYCVLNHRKVCYFRNPCSVKFSFRFTLEIPLLIYFRSQPDQEIHVTKLMSSDWLFTWSGRLLTITYYYRVHLVDRYVCLVCTYGSLCDVPCFVPILVKSCA